MAKVRKYWPMALSGVCLSIALYYAFTDTAYVLEGCPMEVYPELGFLFIVAPVALIALGLAMKVVLADSSVRSRRTSLIASVALSLVCLVLTMAAIWPTGSSCH